MMPVVLFKKLEDNFVNTWGPFGVFSTDKYELKWKYQDKKRLTDYGERLDEPIYQICNALFELY